ncbi:hypothetical protein Leryth_015479 [Lithospermum erythrorhizon]|uniref:Mitochondrial import inner membrane translocase subunit Tim21 n=1 Tax=Lithospermum erythrorhizon TaxID=34254 RepID=A0AAV3NSM2_LITER|nr:hypothetical protein Leryth_015479 [Lithospermum erythrorhizon]
MNHIKRSGASLLKNKWYPYMKSQNGLNYFIDICPSRGVSEVGLSGFYTIPLKRTNFSKNASEIVTRSCWEHFTSCFRRVSFVYSVAENICLPQQIIICPAFNEAAGGSFLFQEPRSRSVITFVSPYQLAKINGLNSEAYSFTRSFASRASESTKQRQSETRKDVSNIEDPFDSPTYNIPEKPVTFTEGASYTFIILIGLGLAAAAAYAVFKELIFEPKEYKIFGKALDRIQNDGQVKVRIGSPITGYGSESRNRAARQRIPNRIWTDEEGVEHVEVNFYIRGPHGAGKVYSEMFKDPVDKQWKFMYLIVEIKSPSPAQLMLESYVPA